MEIKQASKRIRVTRISYFFLSIMFTICIAIQVFLAGLAIFVNPVNWAKHISFVHLFELIPILMFVITFVGQMPRWARWQSAGLFGLVFVMYFTANITSVLPVAAAAHPVIAMVLFGSSIKLTHLSFKLIKKDKEL